MLRQSHHKNESHDGIKDYILGWLSDTTAGGATTFFNGVDLVVLPFFMATQFLIFRSDSGLQKVLQGSGTESSLMVPK